MRFSELRKVVEQLVAAAGGGSGGLVVGPWHDVYNGDQAAPGNFPVDPTTIDFAASPVPWELWMQFQRTAPEVNGFSLVDPLGTGGTIASDYNDGAVYPSGELRGIVPAGLAVQLSPSGDTSTIAIAFILRRPLG
jgi:hypothetical protein